MEKVFSRVRINSRVKNTKKAQKPALVCANCGAYTTNSTELRDFANGDFLNKCPICEEYFTIERKNIITKTKYEK